MEKQSKKQQDILTTHHQLVAVDLQVLIVVGGSGSCQKTVVDELASETTVNSDPVWWMNRQGD